MWGQMSNRLDDSAGEKRGGVEMRCGGAEESFREGGGRLLERGL
jgi:hypothetical protein